MTTNGNILNKTDYGNYYYSRTKVNAVTSVDNTTGIINTTSEQVISYTPFNKTSVITENNDRLQFTYGPDYSCKMTEQYLISTNTKTRTRYFMGDYEKTIDISTATTAEVNYINGPSSIIGMYVTRNGTGNTYYTYTDHLGSILTVTNQSGNIVAEQSFDAWGRNRNPNNWSFTALPSLPSWLYRGYTGHEHLPQFSLINMNGRMYDPLVGRMLSPDNFVQDATDTQTYNRYTYALNNPLIYTDPSGDFIVPYFLFFTQTGYDLQKLISPVAVKANINLFGSDQRGVGFDISVGVPKTLPLSYRKNYGETYFWKNFENNSGWEERSGGEWSYASGLVSISGAAYDNNSKTNQTTNTVTIGNPFVNFRYENDYMFGIQLPGVPKADEGDRYRTAAANLKILHFSTGINIFTGDPGLRIEDRSKFRDKDYNNRWTYQKNAIGNDPDEYRAGVFYVGSGPVKIGANSEGIRHVFQNRFAHDFLMNGRPSYFKVDKTIKPKWYWNFGSESGNTLW